MAHKQLPPKETVLELRKFIIKRIRHKTYKKMILNILDQEIYNCMPYDHASYHRFGDKEEYKAFLKFKQHYKK